MSFIMRMKPLRLNLLLLALCSNLQIAWGATTLTGFYPTGVNPGSKTEVTVSGSFDNWPVSFWCNNPEVKITPGTQKGKITLEASSKAPIGPCWIRAYDSRSFSAEKVFFLGYLSETMEAEPNDLPSQPQMVTGPKVISGKLQKAGDVDCFSYSLKKGETLVASVIANQLLQAPMDAILQVISPEGFVLAQDHDENKLDPELVFTAPQNGEYIVRLFAFPSTPDSTIRFAGGDNYCYRLTLTHGPFPIAPWPLAMGAKAPGKVGLKGWNLGGIGAVSINQAKETSEPETLAMPGWGQTVTLLRTRDNTEIFDPNISKTPRQLPISLSLESRRAGQVDVISFHATQGKSLEILAQSDSLGWQMHPVLKIRDPKGNLAQTLESGALHKDTEGTFTPKTDGIHKLEISDLFDHHSPRHLCHISVRDASPEWELKANGDSVKLEAAKPSELVLALTPKNGFNSIVEIEARGLPQGVKMARKESGKPGEKNITLVFTTNPNFLPGAFQLWAWPKDQPDQKRRIVISRENLPNRPDFWIQMVPGESSKTPMKPG